MTGELREQAAWDTDTLEDLVVTMREYLELDAKRVKDTALYMQSLIAIHGFVEYVINLQTIRTLAAQQWEVSRV